MSMNKNQLKQILDLISVLSVVYDHLSCLDRVLFESEDVIKVILREEEYNELASFAVNANKISDLFKKRSLEFVKANFLDHLEQDSTYKE